MPANSETSVHNGLADIQSHALHSPPLLGLDGELGMLGSSSNDDRSSTQDFVLWIPLLAENFS